MVSSIEWMNIINKEVTKSRSLVFLRNRRVCQTELEYRCIIYSKHMGFITTVPFGIGEFSETTGRKQVLKEPRHDMQPICFSEPFL